jgi:hypothetical protein
MDNVLAPGAQRSQRKRSRSLSWSVSQAIHHRVIASSIASTLTHHRPPQHSSPRFSKRKCQCTCFSRRTRGMMRMVPGNDIAIGWGARRGNGGARRDMAKWILMQRCWLRVEMPRRSRATLLGDGRDRGGSEQSPLLCVIHDNLTAVCV